MEQNNQLEKIQLQISWLNQYVKAAKDRKEQGRWLLDEKIVQDAEYILKHLIKQAYSSQSSHTRF